MKKSKKNNNTEQVQLNDDQVADELQLVHVNPGNNDNIIDEERQNYLRNHNHNVLCLF